MGIFLGSKVRRPGGRVKSLNCVERANNLLNSKEMFLAPAVVARPGRAPYHRCITGNHSEIRGLSKGGDLAQSASPASGADPDWRRPGNPLVRTRTGSRPRPGGPPAKPQ